MTLNVPDNIPADALEIAQEYIDALAQQDAGGGLKSFGFWVETDDGFHVGAISSPVMLDIVGKSLNAAHTLARMVSDKPCDCAECRAERPGEPKATPEAQTNGLFDRVFGRGRK